VVDGGGDLAASRGTTGTSRWRHCWTRQAAAAR